MYGAEAVQLCTSVIQNGFGIAKTILDGLERFMEEQGYESIHEMAGLACRYVCAPGEMDYRDVAARIDEEKCTGCRLCTKIASCNAISYRAADKNVSSMSRTASPAVSAAAYARRRRSPMWKRRRKLNYEHH